MASKVKAVSANLPARRRRESSSDDFGNGSLGSIAGSAFESNSVDKTAPALEAIKNPIETLEIASIASTKGSGSVMSRSPSGRRPFRKRAGTIDFSLNLDDDAALNLGNTDDHSKILPTLDALPPMDSLPIEHIGESDSTIIREGRSRSQSISLDHLDTLGREAGEAIAKTRGSKSRANSFSNRSKDSENSCSHGTMTSQSHKFLIEAFMGDAEESLMLDHKRERLGSFDTRDRLGSFDVRDRLGSFDVRDRLGSFESSKDRQASFEGTRPDRAPSLDVRELASLERGRSGSMNFRRERLESWGGMSELSVPMQGDGSNDGGSKSAAALAAKLYTSLANDLTAAANLDGSNSVSSFLVNDEIIPTKISVTRERFNSIASESSALDLQLPGEAELGSELQKFVKAAMASVGDQIAEIATSVDPATEHLHTENESLASSTISPMIGAASDTGSKAASLTGRARSNSTSSALNISVDYDAVAAAVDAAQAAAGAIDLETFASMGPSPTTAPTAMAASKNKKRKVPKLPLKRPDSNLQSSSQKKPAPTLPLHMKLPPIPKSKMDDKDMEILRDRARAAAGYVPPSSLDSTPMPSKKKAKLDSSIPLTPGYKPSDMHQTPRTSNTAYKSLTPGMPYTPSMSTPGSAKSAVSKGQSSQKWDSMFDCLLDFIKDRKKDETKDMSEEEEKRWLWDGNVPTTFKTKDGKALGRWVNNQRSAKSKGVLKDDREKRLVDAGLKWSVLASNSWNEMLEELRIYVNAQTKAGRKWDGNVPTNYRIKTKHNAASKDDEDKNLGRWVNRQRSLFQAGKLRKDRQHSLEKVGLKWSMLATTSWESMYETLCDYVKAKTKDGAEWDGNVPANYRTEDNPPRALGRWINRQRSAYGKDKLKKEYVEKLNKIGLKWSVHERRPVSTPDSVKSGDVVTPRPSLSMSAIKVVVKSAASGAIPNGVPSSKAGLPPKAPLARPPVGARPTVTEPARPNPSVAAIKAVVKNAASGATPDGVPSSKAGLPPKVPPARPPADARSSATVPAGRPATATVARPAATTAATKPPVVSKTPPVVAKHLSAVLKTPPVVAKPLPAVVRTQPVTAKPPGVLKAQPVVTKPPPVVAKDQTVVAKPFTAKTKPLVPKLPPTAIKPPGADIPKTQPAATKLPDAVSKNNPAVAKPSATAVPKTEQLPPAAIVQNSATKPQAPSTTSVEKTPSVPIKKEEESQGTSAPISTAVTAASAPATTMAVPAVRKSGPDALSTNPAPAKKPKTS